MIRLSARLLFAAWVLLLVPVGAQPAIYTCPMHPAIRGQQGDRCSICSMALVPATPGAIEPYALDVTTMPRAIRARAPVQVRFAVRDPKTGTAVTHFDLVHERWFHLFVVSRDLEYFAHIHPTLHPDGRLDATLTVPADGAYQLIADFVPIGAWPQLVQRSFVTAGYRGRLTAVPALTSDTADKIVDGTRVKLTMPDAIAGREQLVTFELTDADSGKAATDVEPYLGAAGHLLLVSADLVVAMHSHPVAQLSTASGPDVVFQVLFPRVGEYRMWAQFQRHGHVLTVPFTVPVRERF